MPTVPSINALNTNLCGSGCQFGVSMSVSLPREEWFLGRYSGELSVRQAQRLLIAMAILHKPSLVIADEPTSALDVITQSEILKLFSRLNHGLKMAGTLYLARSTVSERALPPGGYLARRRDCRVRPHRANFPRSATCLHAAPNRGAAEESVLTKTALWRSRVFHSAYKNLG